jgi:hypothetical protein
MSEAVEALKISLKQEADGIIVAFRIHPDDLPTDLLRARINSRFALAFQQISDDEKLVPTPAHPIMQAVEKKKKQNANVMRAGMACAERKFQHFLQYMHADLWKETSGGNTEKAEAILRFLTNVDSRREYATNPKALKMFDTIMGQYEMWKRGM